MVLSHLWWLIWHLKRVFPSVAALLMGEPLFYTLFRFIGLCAEPSSSAAVWCTAHGGVVVGAGAVYPNCWSIIAKIFALSRENTTKCSAILYTFRFLSIYCGCFSFSTMRVYSGGERFNCTEPAAAALWFCYWVDFYSSHYSAKSLKSQELSSQNRCANSAQLQSFLGLAD